MAVLSQDGPRVVACTPLTAYAYAGNALSLLRHMSVCKGYNVTILIWQPQLSFLNCVPRNQGANVSKHAQTHGCSSTEAGPAQWALQAQCKLCGTQQKAQAANFKTYYAAFTTVQPSLYRVCTYGTPLLLWLAHASSANHWLVAACLTGPCQNGH
jgi:hypothetical protein